MKVKPISVAEILFLFGYFARSSMRACPPFFSLYYYYYYYGAAKLQIHKRTLRYLCRQ